MISTEHCTIKDSDQNKHTHKKKKQKEKTTTTITTTKDPVSVPFIFIKHSQLFQQTNFFLIIVSTGHPQHGKADDH